MEGLRPPSLPETYETSTLTGKAVSSRYSNGHAAAVGMLSCPIQQQLDSPFLPFTWTHGQPQQPITLGDAEHAVPHDTSNTAGVMPQPTGSTSAVAAQDTLQHQQQQQADLTDSCSAPTVTGNRNSSQPFPHQQQAGVHALLPAMYASTTVDPFSAAADANAAACTAAAVMIARCDDTQAVLTGIPHVPPAVPPTAAARTSMQPPSIHGTNAAAAAADAYAVQAFPDQQQQQHTLSDGHKHPPPVLGAAPVSGTTSHPAVPCLQQGQGMTDVAPGMPWLASWPLAANMAGDNAGWSAEAAAAFQNAYAATVAANGFPLPGYSQGTSNAASAAGLAGQAAMQIPVLPAVLPAMARDTSDRVAGQPESLLQQPQQGTSTTSVGEPPRAAHVAAGGHATALSAHAAAAVEVTANSHHQVGLSPAPFALATTAAAAAAPLASQQQQQLTAQDPMHDTSSASHLAAAAAGVCASSEHPQRRTARRLNDLFEMWAAQEGNNAGGSSAHTHPPHTGSLQHHQQHPGSIVLSLAAPPRSGSATPPPIDLVPVYLQQQQQQQALSALEAAAAAASKSGIATAERYGIAGALWALEADTAAAAAAARVQPALQGAAAALTTPAAALPPAQPTHAITAAAAAAPSALNHQAHGAAAPQPSTQQQQRQQPQSPGIPLLMSPGVHHFPAGLLSPLGGLPHSPGQFFSSLDPSGLTALGSPSALQDELHIAMAGSPLASLGQLDSIETALQRVGGSSSDTTPKASKAAAAVAGHGVGLAGGAGASPAAAAAAAVAACSNSSTVRAGTGTPPNKAGRTAAAAASFTPQNRLSSGRQSYSNRPLSLQSPDALFKTPKQRSVGSLLSPFGAAQHGTRGDPGAAAADRDAFAGLEPAFGGSGLFSSPVGAAGFMTPVSTRLLPHAGSWMSGALVQGSSLMSPFQAAAAAAAAAAGSPALLPSPAALITHHPLSSYTQLPNGAAYWGTGVSDSAAADAAQADAVVQAAAVSEAGVAAAAVPGVEPGAKQQQPKRAASVIAGAGARLHAAADNAAQPQEKEELAAAAAAAETAAALAASGTTAPAPAPSLPEDVKAGRAGSDLFNGAALLLGLAAAATDEEESPAAAAAAAATEEEAPPPPAAAAAPGSGASSARRGTTSGRKKSRKKQTGPSMEACTGRELLVLRSSAPAVTETGHCSAEVADGGATTPATIPKAVAAVAPAWADTPSLPTVHHVSAAAQMLPPAGRSQVSHGRSKVRGGSSSTSSGSTRGRQDHFSHKPPAAAATAAMTATTQRFPDTRQPPVDQAASAAAAVTMPQVLPNPTAALAAAAVDASPDANLPKLQPTCHDLSGPVRPAATAQPDTGTPSTQLANGSLSKKRRAQPVHVSAEEGGDTSPGVAAWGGDTAAERAADAGPSTAAAAAAVSVSPAVPAISASKDDVMLDTAAAAVVGAAQVHGTRSASATNVGDAGSFIAPQAEVHTVQDLVMAATAAMSPQKPPRLRLQQQPGAASTGVQQHSRRSPRGRTAPNSSSTLPAATAAATLWPAVGQLYIADEMFTLPDDMLLNRQLIVQQLQSKQQDERQQDSLNACDDDALAPDVVIATVSGDPVSSTVEFKTPAATQPKMRINVRTNTRPARSTVRPQPGTAAAAAADAAQVQREAAAAVAAEAADVQAEAAEAAPQVAAAAAAANTALVQVAAGAAAAPEPAVRNAIAAAFPDAVVAASDAIQAPATPAVVSAAATGSAAGMVETAAVQRHALAAATAPQPAATAPAEMVMEVEVTVPAAAADDDADEAEDGDAGAATEADAAAETVNVIAPAPASAVATAAKPEEPNNGSTCAAAAPATYPASPVPPPPRPAAAELGPLFAAATDVVTATQAAEVAADVTAEGEATLPARNTVALLLAAPAVPVSRSRSPHRHKLHAIHTSGAASAPRADEAPSEVAEQLVQQQPAAVEAIAAAVEAIAAAAAAAAADAPASAASDPHDVAEALTALAAQKEQRLVPPAAAAQKEQRRVPPGTATEQGVKRSAGTRNGATPATPNLSAVPDPPAAAAVAALGVVGAAASHPGNPGAQQQQQQQLEFQPFFIDPDSPQTLRLRPKRAAAKDADRRLKQQQQQPPVPLPTNRNSASSSKSAAAEHVAVTAGVRNRSRSSNIAPATASMARIAVQQQSRRPSGKVEKQHNKSVTSEPARRASPAAAATAASRQGTEKKRKREGSSPRSSIDDLAAAAAAAAAGDGGDDAGAAALARKQGTAPATRGVCRAVAKAAPRAEKQLKHSKSNSVASSKHKQRAPAAAAAKATPAPAAAGHSRRGRGPSRSVPIQHRGLGNMGLALLSVVQQETARASGEEEEQDAALQEHTSGSSQQEENTSHSEEDYEDESESADAVSDMSDSSSEWAGSSDAESSGSDAASDADSDYAQAAAAMGSKKRQRQTPQSAYADADAAKKSKATSGRSSSAANSTGTAPAAANGGPRNLPAAALALQAHNPKGGRPLGAGNKGRMVPRFTNQQGQLKFGCRSTSHTGVYRCKRNTVRWRTQFSYGGKVLNVGSYSTEEEAARAWNAAAIHFRGRDTLLNAVEPILPEDGGVAVAQALPQPPWGSQLLNSLPEGQEAPAPAAAAAAGQDSGSDQG